MFKVKKQKKSRKPMKGDDGMQAVLNEDTKLKLQLLKSRAHKVLKDESLRLTPNDHDIKKSSDNTKLLHTHQQDTITKAEL